MGGANLAAQAWVTRIRVKGKGMNPTAFVLITLLVLLAIFAFKRARHAPPMGRAGPTAAARARVQRSAVPSPASTGGAHANRPGMVEWEGLEARPIESAPDRHRAHLRDRYIAARFPGVFRKEADLAVTEYVIKVARHLLEEGNFGLAAELFALAIPLSPDKLALRLAQIEIAFLARDRGLFISLARSLRAAHPEAVEWKDVVRLGWTLAPDEELFAGHKPLRAEEHYGPWPEMPNWIQASWDLTYEVLAAEFHRAVRVHPASAVEPAARLAA
jgi:hypothetical protein